MYKHFLPFQSLFWVGGLFAFNLSANTLEGMPGTLFSPLAQPLGHMELAISVGALGHQGEGMVRDGAFYFRETGQVGDPEISQIEDFQSGTLKFNLALGIGRFVDLGLSIPYFVDYVGDTKAKELSGHGLGDPNLFAKAGFPLVGDHILTGGFIANLTVPSKNPAGFLPKQPSYMKSNPVAGDPYFFSSYEWGGGLQTLLTLDLTRLELPIPFRASLNLGGSHSGAPGTSEQALLGLGLEWIPLPSLEFWGNFQTSTRGSQFGTGAEIGKEYSFAAIGFTATGEEGLFFTVGLQKSLSQSPYHAYAKSIPGGKITYEARFQPSLALALNLGWSGQLIPVDTDGDGIEDKEDLCTTQAEDLDHFQDQDGCPEIDNDLDSIYDAMDKCPIEPEDRDGFQDEDGCLEPDNDKDGIPDLQDKCINDPEDQDAYEDYDGCPDLDNDKDGVVDAADKCPMHAEDRDGFEDSDGCSETDNDKDKILDGIDKCPNEAENLNGIEDADGCPDQVQGLQEPAVPQLLESRIQLRQVRFDGATAKFLPDSYPSLDALASQIKANLNALVEVRGYVDANMNELEGMRLSEARAMAVRDYLFSKGIAPKQVLARGMGARDPIASNRTAAGRMQNRRIEVHRLDQ